MNQICREFLQNRAELYAIGSVFSIGGFEITWRLVLCWSLLLLGLGAGSRNIKKWRCEH
ncbi:hypothetical protein TSUD_24080 [Trifolium subterraneum]|uniref:Uncharacterized protein n=1 Tax=Trifolium subterraneum TaxID=3900 RepID=A0A2Z6PF26_TRISU|nr:hypothetical protein TSUD_24080 [Trifolium subterraneum]